MHQKWILLTFSLCCLPIQSSLDCITLKKCLPFKLLRAQCESGYKIYHFHFDKVFQHFSVFFSHFCEMCLCMCLVCSVQNRKKCIENNLNGCGARGNSYTDKLWRTQPLSLSLALYHAEICTLKWKNGTFFSVCFVFQKTFSWLVLFGFKLHMGPIFIFVFSTHYIPTKIMYIKHNIHCKKK